MICLPLPSNVSIGNDEKFVLRFCSYPTKHKTLHQYVDASDTFKLSGIRLNSRSDDTLVLAGEADVI